MTLRAIRPDWPAPANVFALCTSRTGGRSLAPYASLNLAQHVGDVGSAVADNRQILEQALPGGSTIQWLSQVHGTTVIEAGGVEHCPEADAHWSRATNVACAVMTADCLPVLFCSDRGEVVAAAHAGWRGLLAGVLEATVGAMAVEPGQVLAWLGPAIGPQAFEVGAQVRDGFRAAAASGDTVATEACFVPCGVQPGKYLADLYALARLRLLRAGVSQVFGGQFCTYSDARRFFSYRRDGQTGRMASLIMLRPHLN